MAIILTTENVKDDLRAAPGLVAATLAGKLTPPSRLVGEITKSSLDMVRWNRKYTQIKK